jgi:hypothetical protein
VRASDEVARFGRIGKGLLTLTHGLGSTTGEYHVDIWRGELDFFDAYRVSQKTSFWPSLSSMKPL